MGSYIGLSESIGINHVSLDSIRVGRARLFFRWRAANTFEIDANLVAGSTVVTSFIIRPTVTMNHYSYCEFGTAVNLWLSVFVFQDSTHCFVRCRLFPCCSNLYTACKMVVPFLNVSHHILRKYGPVGPPPLSCEATRFLPNDHFSTSISSCGTSAKIQGSL